MQEFDTGKTVKKLVLEKEHTGKTCTLFFNNGQNRQKTESCS